MSMRINLWLKPRKPLHPHALKGRRLYGLSVKYDTTSGEVINFQKKRIDVPQQEFWNSEEGYYDTIAAYHYFVCNWEIQILLPQSEAAKIIRITIHLHGDLIELEQLLDQYTVGNAFRLRKPRLSLFKWASYWVIDDKRFRTYDSLPGH